MISFTFLLRSQRDQRKLYWSLLRDSAKEFNIANDETSQMISFTNRECATLNQFGCYVYNKARGVEIAVTTMLVIFLASVFF